MAVRCKINERIFLLSWEEFEKILSRMPLTSTIDVLDFIRG